VRRHGADRACSLSLGKAAACTASKRRRRLLVDLDMLQRAPVVRALGGGITADI
jgi:hypothetical protein